MSASRWRCRSQRLSSCRHPAFSRWRGCECPGKAGLFHRCCHITQNHGQSIIILIASVSEWSEADQARRGEPVRHYPRQRVLERRTHGRRAARAAAAGLRAASTAARGLHPRRPPGGSTSASPRGWRLRRSPGCWSWVRDRPGHDRGEPKDTPMKLHRHARPDAGVSSSAAPIANSDTRERLRAVLDTPADLPALRTQHRLRGPGSQERLRHIAWPPALAWQQQTLAISIQCPAVCAGQLRACRRRAWSRQA